MDDSFSPSPFRAREYWSAEECRWVPVDEPLLPMPVGLPQQRSNQPVEEPVEA